MATITKKSPLTDSPLRNPGQSLDEHMSDLADSVVMYLFFAAGYVALAMVAWIAWLSRKPLNPYLLSLLAVGLIVLAAYKFVKFRRDILRLRMARDGEKAVGQYLEFLRSSGAQVFHDVIGDGFNLDHVIISPHGIFAVETKTYHKPARGQAIITIQDDRLYANGLEIDRDPLAQARAEAHWLKHLLKDSTGKKFHITPVIVFPGWYVEPQKGTKDVWVLNPKALPAFLTHAPLSLNQSDVYLAAYHLSRYIRTKAKTG